METWLKVNKTSGTGNDTLIVTCEANTGLEREGTITIKTQGNKIVEVKINQKKLEDMKFIYIDPVSSTATSTDGPLTGQQLYNIVSDKTWGENYVITINNGYGCDTVVTSKKLGTTVTLHTALNVSAPSASKITLFGTTVSITQEGDLSTFSGMYNIAPLSE